MSRSWSITLGDTELDGLIKDLQVYQRDLDNMCSDLAAIVGEYMRRNAEAGFASSTVNGGHTPEPVSVYVTTAPQRAVVIAMGEQVAFIEFGAGVYYNGSGSPHPDGDGTIVNFTIGSYGKGQGNNQSWKYFDGRWHTTNGTPCQAPLWWAMTDTMPLVQDIARRVFNP